MYYLLCGALGAASGLGWYLFTGQWQMPYWVFVACAVGCTFISDLMERLVESMRARGARPAGYPLARHRKKVL